MAQIAASISEASRTERQDDLIARLGRVRAATLARVASVDDTLARTQIDPDFSPLGWHLGHIAFIEALWLLEDGREAAFTATDRILWRADGLPRDQRGTTLPRLDEQIGILAETRKSVLATLERPFTRRVELLISFVLQHETMHAEIMGMLLALGDQREGGGFAGQDTSPPRIDLVKVPEGAFIQGHSGPEALDNERWPQRVALPAFRIARRPATQAEFARFIAAGGYDDERLWSARGWAWRKRAGFSPPRHWRKGQDARPVAGVNAFEAEAYCRWLGLRLPSEAEWEKAALLSAGDGVLCRGMIGSVWQWTASEFAPYQGFKAWPYEGYSVPSFGRGDRVLKGGSHASGPEILRPSFRNWYPPETRALFAGIRPACDVTGP